MRGDQEDHVGVLVVGRRAVVAAPHGVPEAGAGRADIGVGVVAVHSPGEQHALDEAVLTVPTHVVHDLFATVLFDRRADATGDIVENVIPRHALELGLPALTHPLHRVQDPLGIGGLVDRGRALGAVAAAGSGVGRVALDFDDFLGLLVHVGKEPAGGFAVEARGGDQHVVLGDLARMGLGVVHDDVVPLLDRRIVGHRFADAQPMVLGVVGADRRSGRSVHGFRIPWSHRFLASRSVQDDVTTVVDLERPSRTPARARRGQVAREGRRVRRTRRPHRAQSATRPARRR